MAHGARGMEWWRTRQSLTRAAIFVVLWCCSNAQRIYRVTPRVGSTNGGVRLTIEGEGFAQENQFQLNPQSDDFGNSVTLVSNTRSIPCDVERDQSHGNQVMCYTRPMPRDQYVVHVSVDGVPIPDSKICRHCSVYTRWWRTPTIQSLVPVSGPPGTVVKVRGRIYSDVYGSNTHVSSNGYNVRFLRAYMGGMPCELLKPESDELYGLTLDSESSVWGHMSCKLTGTYVGHHNLSYILDSDYGRSLPDKKLFTVSALNKLAMFQTYAEVTGVSPSAGSLLGGTLLTIHGRFFDQTDRPASVLVGGRRCEVQSVSDERITCTTPEQPPSNATVFPGSRGLKFEIWNDTNPRSVEEVLTYNETWPGRYWTGWTDALPLTLPRELDFFSGKLRGFFVPTESDDYTFYIRGDDRCELYLSLTGNPKDKARIAYHHQYTPHYHWRRSQKSDVMALEKGKAYYIEILMHDWGWDAFVDVGFFKGKSRFTREQTEDAVNEQQLITAKYDVSDEKQVVSFEDWPADAVSVKEVQRVTVNSSCFAGQNLCGKTFYRLAYGAQKTGLIPVNAPADLVQTALNDLWTIAPDVVTVTKQTHDNSAHYTVTFNSERGDFEALGSEVLGAEVNVSVTEVTRGGAGMQTFTLRWGGVPSRPITFNASASEVQSALVAMVSAECPSEILSSENSDVKYFRDFEEEVSQYSGDERGTPVNDTEAFCGLRSLKNAQTLFRDDFPKEPRGTYGPVPLQQYKMLCLAYKGHLKNGMGVRFTYRNTQGRFTEDTAKIPVLFNQGDKWSYTCVDLLSALQTDYVGGDYRLLQLYLYKESPSKDFYVDAVYLGKRAAANGNVVMEKRRPPAIGSSGRFFQEISVVRHFPKASGVSYEITATPLHCAFDFPLLDIAFLERMPNNTVDMTRYMERSAIVTVTRTHSASPPLTGTFHAELYGRRVEGLAVNVSAEDLRYALQGVPGAGQLSVKRDGDCRVRRWRVNWLSAPGDQPLLQINSSSVRGVNPRVAAQETRRGGLFKQSLSGDFLRVWESKPQVEVHINGIPSKCSGDCSFEWAEARTPVITGISPSQGSDGLGTLLTVTGAGFGSENATVWVGDARCPLERVTDSTQVCRVGPAGAGRYPVWVTFPSLGNARYGDGDELHFTYRLILTAFTPASGSLAGGTLLTVRGFGLGRRVAVTIGNGTCDVVAAGNSQLTCRTSAGVAGSHPVTVRTGNTSETASGAFTYDHNLTPLVTNLSPPTTNVFGRRVLTITGANLGERANGSAVYVGGEACRPVRWTPGNVTCLLPALPPGRYDVEVRVGNYGYPETSDGVNASIQYVLEVWGLSPARGSLFGGTRLSIPGSGFSTNVSDNRVSVGGEECEVRSASERELQCVIQIQQRTHTVTNQGSHPELGRGYAWSPPAVTVWVGERVEWRWAAPPLVPGLGYRVFSVATPSSAAPDGASFTSGDTKTPTGVFSYRFTAPGVFYYSSGFVDPARSALLQGAVFVRPAEERSARVSVSVGGVEARHATGPHRTSRAAPECTASLPANCTEGGEGEGGSDAPIPPGLWFSFSACATPVVRSISPDRGDAHQVIRIQGTGFSRTPCANEVTVGGFPCRVLNSSLSELTCRLRPDSGAPVGLALPVSVAVRNLGVAIVAIPREHGRRFALLPAVDSVYPAAGSTTGHARLLVRGSGFVPGARVTAAGAPCAVRSLNYTHVVCDSSPSPAGRGDVVVWAGGVRSSCRSDCSFLYDASLAPAVDGVSPDSVDGGANATAVVVRGNGFGDCLDDVAVFAEPTGVVVVATGVAAVGDVAFAGRRSLEVVAVADGNVSVKAGPLPAGEYRVTVVVRSRGLAVGEAVLTSAARAAVAPDAGSLAGGTPLVLSGNGFLPGRTAVTVGGVPCAIQDVTPGRVRCWTPPGAEGTAAVRIRVLAVDYPPLNYTYSAHRTPVVSGVSPASGDSGTAITVTGTGFDSDPRNIRVSVNDAPCNVSAVSHAQVQCIVGENPGGTYPLVLHHQVKGYARSESTFTYDLVLSGVQPHQGSYGGGATLTVQGSGFDPRSSAVRICGRECVVERNASTSTHLYCEAPSNNGTQAELSCSVSVSNQLTAVNQSDGFAYKSSLTPVIVAVTPRRGGTAGGTRLTITGSGFSADSGGEVSVTVGGSVCAVRSANDTTVVCVTGPQRRSQRTEVRLRVGDRGVARTDDGAADFFYVDVWSSRFTWGGLPPPEKGSFAVITKGQTVLLDTSTPVLKLLLIQGGTLVFDEADIELQAENILITDGGVLQVGQEGAPFLHKAIITLHGHLRSPELPIYGTKTLAVREGVLDLHGIPVPVPWTHLAQTAPSGSATLSLVLPVTWKTGDEIVIASTGHRHSQRESEVRRIASVSPDGQTLALSEPLSHTHLGVSVTLPNGTALEGRAEVGLLTKNVVVRGADNVEWSDRIEACPDGFDTGEFATQTCFQGRFGEEVGSDQFGGCIMFHTPRPNENLAIGRLEYVELFHVGQAFRLGRYPIHWHLLGDVGFRSYVRGCSIHRSFNRAVTIHNTHQLLVERNVIYNIMGGAFFIQDGIETGNVLQFNLAVFVRQSTSLLNDDVTPAAFWVTNANNTVRHNAAAAGTHFGFWYRMNEHPDGPSYDPGVCQKRVPLGEFANNTAHSQGWFGLWIFKDFFPMVGGGCRSRVPEPAVFRTLTAWNCEKGAEWVNAGAVQFSGFLLANNEKAGVEAKRVVASAVRGFGESGGALVINSTVVGHVDELGLGGAYCTARGVILPLDDGMSVVSTRFVSFDRASCAAIGVTAVDGTCVDRCGGWAARFAGVRFVDSPNRAAFRWEHEVQLVDTDGSLTGNAGHKVVPMSPLLDMSRCARSAEWSAGFPGAVCDDSVSFHRLAFNNPSPSSLRAKDAILTNAHGTSVVPYLKKRMTHKLGWMALLPSAQTYNWYFEDVDQITNITYSAKFYSFKPEDYVIVHHNLTQSPNSFRIVDRRNASDLPLSHAANQNGDWYFDAASNDLYYLVSGRRSQQRRRRSSVDPDAADVAVNFQVYRCFFPNCVRPPPPPPATLAPIPARRPEDYVLWSNASFWRASAENNFTVPTAGADVTIPSGCWIVLDEDTPPLNRLRVVGVLEIPDTLNATSGRQARSGERESLEYRTVVLDATYISIQGGRLIAGWEDEPFRGTLLIRLRGEHSTPDWPLPNGPNQGAKVLGVFGRLDLYGTPHDVYHTKLASTAPAGSTSLTLDRPVDWQAGDAVVVSTTSFDAWQTESRRVAAVSPDRRTLTLDRALAHTHVGETHRVNGTARSYRLAADVGLLSRNIRIVGQDYPGQGEEAFGARVLVGRFSWQGVDYRGQAQIRNVEFYRSGQQGWSDFTDPRYSVAFLNLGEVEGHGSYVQGCSFHHGFSPAIGVFGTERMNVDDNVVFFAVGEGIRVWGGNVGVRRNLVTMTLWPGSYQDREEPFNFEWNAAIEVNEGYNVVLQDNVVAGYERVGYRVDGEPCPGSARQVESWHGNEAHGGLYGVYMNKDGLPGCSLVQGFTVWRSYDYGVYLQVAMSVVLANLTLVDNGMSVFSIVYSPPSLSHQYSDKTVRVQDTLIVGSSPNFNCSDGVPASDYNIRNSDPHRAPRHDGAMSGICWPSFLSAHNTAPEKPHAGVMSYNAISGLMTVTDTTLAGFSAGCSGGRNVMFMTNPMNEDLQHPVEVRRLRLVDSTEGSKVFIHRPDVRKANPADCVDMDCDAKKKTMLTDLDGSFLGGAAGGSVVPQSEYEWDGDARRGLGDYRIPKVMLTFPNGSRIPVEQIAPNKGVIRDDSCSYMSAWQSYKCFGLDYKMLVMESLDADTETRRLSPVAVLGDGYVDLINGPQDHGWCSGYTCQERVSLFHSVVATGKAFDVYFTSVSPQKLRLMLLNARPTESVRVAVFYSNPQRLDVYVKNTLVPPNNAVWNEDKTDYTLQEPAFPGQFVPRFNASAASGSNYFDRDSKMLSVLLLGPAPVEVRTSPLLVVSFRLPAMTADDFYGEDLVRNLALFLRVPAGMIRVTKIVREDGGEGGGGGGGGRRKRAAGGGLSVSVEIKNPPVRQTTNATDDEEGFALLKNIANDLGRAAVTGNLSRSIGFNVSSLGVVPPPPSPSDPAWSEVATKEVTREEPTVSFVSTVARLALVVEPMAGEYEGPLAQQPSLMAVDEQGNCVSVGVTSLTVTAALRVAGGEAVAGLEGNSTILFSGCWANYTDLTVMTSGTNLTMAFALNEWNAQSRSFTVKATPTTVTPVTDVAPTNQSTVPDTTATTTPTTITTITTTIAESTTVSTTEDDSIFDRGAAFSPGALCLASLVYALSLLLL